MFKSTGKKFTSGKGVLRKNVPKYHLVPNKTGTRMSWMLVDPKIKVSSTKTPVRQLKTPVKVVPRIGVKPVTSLPINAVTQSSAIAALHQNPAYQKVVDSIQPNHITELNSNGYKVLVSPSKHALLMQDDRLTNEHITSTTNYKDIPVHSVAYSTSNTQHNITTKETPPEHNEFAIHPNTYKMQDLAHQTSLNRIVSELKPSQVAEFTLSDGTLVFASRKAGDLNTISDTKSHKNIASINLKYIPAQESFPSESQRTGHFIAIAPSHVSSVANQSTPSKEHKGDYFYSDLNNVVIHPDVNSAKAMYDIAIHLYNHNELESSTSPFKVSTSFQVNKLDPDSIRSFNPTASGTTTLMKDNNLVDHEVHTVMIHDEDGELLRHESYFQLREPNSIVESFFAKHGEDISSEETYVTEADKSGKLRENPEHEQMYALIMYDPSNRDEGDEGEHMRDDDVRARNFTPYHYKASDGTELIYHSSNMDTYKGLVTVISHKPEEVERNVQNALKLVGLAHEYASASDVEHYRWITTARAVLSNDEFQAVKSLKTPEIQAKIKQRYPNVNQILDPFPTQLSNGRVVHTLSSEFFDKVIDPSIKDAYHSVSDPNLLTTIANGGGLLSTVDRFRQKTNVYGMSSTADVENGGGQHVYTRLSPIFSDVQVGSKATAGCHIKIDPQIYRVINQYSYSADVFGIRDKAVFDNFPSYAEAYHNRRPSWEVAQSLMLKPSESYTGGLGSNETMIKHTLSPEFMKSFDYIISDNSKNPLADNKKDYAHAQNTYDNLPTHLKGKLNIRVVEVSDKNYRDVTSVKIIGGSRPTSVADFPF